LGTLFVPKVGKYFFEHHSIFACFVESKNIFQLWVQKVFPTSDPQIWNQYEMRSFSPLGFSPLAIGVGKGEYSSSVYSTRLHRNSTDITFFALHPFNLLHGIEMSSSSYNNEGHGANIGTFCRPLIICLCIALVT
jgi:hypothetical protein